MKKETHLETKSIVLARERFAETVNKVAYGGCRIILTRKGISMAALVSMDDLDTLEKLKQEDLK